jgi:hypothetical protein
MEGSGGRFPVVLKLQQALGEEIQAREFVQGEDLSLHDRKVNLDLIEPTGMSGSMDELYDRTPGLSLAQAFQSPLPAMRGTVVHDPENTTSIVVGGRVSTCSTGLSNGAIPFTVSHLPNTLALWTSKWRCGHLKPLWTSKALRYTQAPPFCIDS